MRLIDADAYTQEINNRIEAAIKWGKNAIDEEIKTRAEQAIATFCEASLTAKKMPTIEAEPIRHGEWVHIDPNYEDSDVRCTNCNEVFNYIDGVCYLVLGTELPHRCPNCGAKMDKRAT